MPSARPTLLSSWNTPEQLEGIRSAAPEQRSRLWRELCRLTDDGDARAVAAVNAALVSWDDHERRAPLSSFAVVEAREATGPHDPGDTVVVGMRDTFAWPIAIARHLDLRATGLSESRLEALSGRTELAHITSVDINVGKTPGVVQSMLGTFPALRSVTLHGMLAEAAALTSLLPTLPATLSSVSLSWFLEGAAAPLCQALHKRLQAGMCLEALTLEKCRLGEGLVDVINTGALASLRSLTLHGTQLNDQVARAWARAWTAEVRAPLRQLDLQDDPFDGGFEVGDGFVDLVDAGVFNGLHHLRVGYHGLGGHRLRHLLASADLAQLHTLQLWAVSFHDDDARALIDAAARLPALRTVEVETDALSADLSADLKTALTTLGRRDAKRR